MLAGKISPPPGTISQLTPPYSKGFRNRLDNQLIEDSPYPVDFKTKYFLFANFTRQAH